MSVREVLAMLAISRAEAGWLRLAAIGEGLFEREGQRLDEAAPEEVCRPN
jgi:hypothetical protein